MSTTKSPETASTVLGRVSRGESGAVEECMDAYGGLVWSLARRMLPDVHSAEDAVQDIFIDVWKNAGRFDRSMGSEATFIATIARRRLIDRLRKMGRRPAPAALQTDMHSPIDTSEGAANASGLSEEAQVAREALESLSDDQQRVLQLAIFHGQTHERIATATGLPLGTVKTHARRGLIKVREALAEWKQERRGAQV